MLTERKLLKSVEIVNSEAEKTANVLWLNQILRDGDIIAGTNHRQSYTKEEKDQFIADVQDGWDYISLLQW